MTVTVTSCPIGYGNLNGYAHHDCRCPECVEAARAYRRARQVDGAPLGSERFPFAPLEDLVTRRLGPARQGNGVEWVGATDGNCARATAMNTRLWIRCRAAGTIRADHADRAAIALGCHPSEIWPDDWWTK